MPINLFDLLFATFLVAGIVHGRKNGVSKEGLGMVKWLCLVLGCALVYRPVAALVACLGIFDDFSSCLVAYLSAALTILLIFSFLQRGLGRKASDTDFFGRGEYYLGMGSGLVRYGCILLMGMALLNARVFTPAEVKADEKYQLDAYGSTVFPTWQTLQEIVFQKSFIGSAIKQNLGFLLINSTPNDALANAPEPPPAKQLTQARKTR